eukprot:CAMPEP_0206487462 /NCGR_PEP_ID=MMETSP0324_2-20121206/41657_1 /ASSEMBLY_ACC=CAM_ASM_000836 /TAXON_ID=2866 /ORGANISM="Crypthecodinium cohnii, Strain Seligo" /LENGTH=43 /DNA_ID= /DNA_START= /DNA_END= /DNA_ORIENTATION=
MSPLAPGQSSSVQLVVTLVQLVAHPSPWPDQPWKKMSVGLVGS